MLYKGGSNSVFVDDIFNCDHLNQSISPVLYGEVYFEHYFNSEWENFKRPRIVHYVHAPSVIVLACTGARLLLFSRGFAFLEANIHSRGKELYRLVLLFSSNVLY